MRGEGLGLALPDHVRAYLETLARRGLSLRTQAVRSRALRLFVDFSLRRGRTDLTDIGPEDVLAFAAAVRARRVPHGPRRGLPLSPNTVNSELAGIRGFFGRLVADGTLLADPTTGLPPMRIQRPLPRALTLREVARLLATAQGKTPRDLRDRAILELFYSSGLRLSELVGLDLTDLDLAGREVVVRHGKGGKSRRVPVGGAAAHALAVYLSDGREAFLHSPAARGLAPGALFLNTFGRRLSGVLVHRMVRCRAQAAGVGRVTPHTLRHTAALHLLRGGADIRYVQVFLGHTCATTTAHYTRLAIDDLKEVLARCHPRNRLGGGFR